MCGRFTRTENELSLQQRFGFEDYSGALPEPSYNIAPSQDCPIVRVEEDRRVLSVMRWGLVPVWSKDAKSGYRMINARGETVAEKPSFKPLLGTRRCLVPASGFYEWQKPDKKTRIPFYFRLKDEGLFAFAGLWTVWHEGKEDELHSFTIITTEANDLMETVHDRMPVILHERDEARWLDPELYKPDQILPLLTPFPSSEMECYRVSSYVNSYKNQGTECVRPVDE